MSYFFSSESFPQSIFPFCFLFPFSIYYFYAKQQDDSFAEKIIDASLTDVDLRQFPSGGVNDAQTGTSATQPTVQNPEEVKATNDVPATGTKRAIDEEEEVPVTSKKSKSDKLDV